MGVNVLCAKCTAGLDGGRYHQREWSLNSMAGRLS